MDLFHVKNKKLYATAIALVSAIVFFAVAFSALNDWVKFGLAVVTLGVSGTLLGLLTGQEHHYGFIILRGVAGFSQMRSIARRYGEVCKSLADFGLTLGFGVFYGARLFGISKKLLGHLIGLAVFYSVFILQPAAVDGWLLVLIGVAAGLFGFGFYFLAQHAFQVLTVPATPPGVVPIVPGVTVPWEVIFALIIVAVVHELAHGVLCLVEKLRVKSSGILLFGVLPVGAFVEPDEKKMAGKKFLPQMRILGAGTTSNALFFVLFLLLALGLSQALPFLVKSVSVGSVVGNSTAADFLNPGDTVALADGVKVRTTSDLQPLMQNGAANIRLADGREASVRIAELEVSSSANPALSEGDSIFGADGKLVYSASDLRSALEGKKQGDVVSLSTSAGVKPVTLNAQGKLGVTLVLKPTVEFRNDAFNPFLFGLFSFLLLVVAFTYMLNFILATVNLLPLFITDGQRMFTMELRRIFGDKLGVKMSIALGLVTLGLLAINALPWFI